MATDVVRINDLPPSSAWREGQLLMSTTEGTFLIPTSTFAATRDLQVASMASLKTTVPYTEGQVIFMTGYRPGSTWGAGHFVSVKKKVTDDAGVNIYVNDTWSWKRIKSPEDLTIADFGGYIDGVNDDVPACKAMYAYTRTLNNAQPIGVRLPAGRIGMKSGWDTGSSEIPLFRMRGPSVGYGVVPLSVIVPLDATSSTPMITVVARRTEMSGLYILGNNTTTPFFKNKCPGGQYFNVRQICCRGNGGLVFDMLDTIDTLFEQIYCYNLSGGFMKAFWSYQDWGKWDHSTAIEIRNANFTGCTKTIVLNCLRATQCMLWNVWFSTCEYTMDVSQGGWKMDTLIVEGSTYPIYSQYAKIQQINCRVEQGATWDPNGTTWTADMDPPDQFNGGKLPNWITNAYDQGQYNINSAGVDINNGLGSLFEFASNWISHTSSKTEWYRLGRLVFQKLGDWAEITVQGVTGWDNIVPDLHTPSHATNWGGGSAKLNLQLKINNAETTSNVEMDWHGTGSCPIKAVRYVKTWLGYEVYVQINAYCRELGVFVKTNARPRMYAGTPFYFTWDGTLVPDMTAVKGQMTPAARWNVNDGLSNTSGFGMDLDAGTLLVNSAKGVVTKGGVKGITTWVNGVQYFIPIPATLDANVQQAYAFASLPSAASVKYGEVFCTNTAKTPALQKVFSDGTNWRYLVDPATVVTAAA